MLPNDHFLALIAKVQYQDRLAEAEAWRLVHHSGAPNQLYPTLKQRLVWSMGDVLISLGQKLHPAQPATLQICEQ
jgi:hypothetical protein